MRPTLACSVAVLLGAAVGCWNGARPAPPAPTIPPASEVAGVHLTSIGSSLKEAYDVTLTKEADIAALVDWLRQIDWSPSRANDLSNVGLAEIGRITVTLKDGTTLPFGLSGGVVIVNRWEWRADTDKLLELGKRSDAKAP